MINPQTNFLLIKKNYKHPLNSANNSGIYSTYGLINKRRYHTISFLFYTINEPSNHHHIFCPILFTACRAITLSKLIELHRIVIMQVSPGHAFYLGIEFMKVELSLIIDHDYIQN